MELNLDSGLWGSPGLRGEGITWTEGWGSPGLRGGGLTWTWGGTHLGSGMGLTWTQRWGSLGLRDGASPTWGKSHLNLGMCPASFSCGFTIGVLNTAKCKFEKSLGEGLPQPSEGGRNGQKTPSLSPWSFLCLDLRPQ